jgi:hypothetical protein
LNRREPKQIVGGGRDARERRGDTCAYNGAPVVEHGEAGHGGQTLRRAGQ